VLVLFSWVLFRSNTVTDAMHYFGMMFGLGGRDAGSALVAVQLYGRGQLIMMAVGAAIMMSPVQAFDWSRVVTWPSCTPRPGFILGLMAMFAQAFNPFLYFQF